MSTLQFSNPTPLSGWEFHIWEFSLGYEGNQTLIPLNQFLELCKTLMCFVSVG